MPRACSAAPMMSRAPVNCENTRIAAPPAATSSATSTARAIFGQSGSWGSPMSRGLTQIWRMRVRATSAMKPACAAGRLS